MSTEETKTENRGRELGSRSKAIFEMLDGNADLTYKTACPVLLEKYKIDLSEKATDGKGANIFATTKNQWKVKKGLPMKPRNVSKSTSNKQKQKSSDQAMLKEVMAAGGLAKINEEIAKLQKLADFATKFVSKVA